MTKVESENDDQEAEDDEFKLIQQCEKFLDPNQVENLLVKELTQMSFDKRERVLEEIHGVPGSRAIKDEEILLEQMQVELDDLERNTPTEVTVTPAETMLRSKTSATATKTTTTLDISAYQNAKMHESELIHDRHFRWTFLNREANDPRKAAIRMIRYLNFISRIYNSEEVLMRPIYLEDLDPAVSEFLHAEGGGVAQILPIRDTAGRRVLAHLNDAECPMKYSQQIGAYISQCLTEDRDGAVMVYFLHNSGHKIPNMARLRMTNELFNVLPIRFDALHMCCPDSPLYEFCKGLLTLHLGKENRIRRRLHVGSYQECKYSLQHFGIGVDRLPLNLETWKWSHDNDTRYFRKWLSVREFKEAAIRAAIVTDESSQDKVSNAGPRRRGVVDIVHCIHSKYVECPYHEDCLFGKGSSVMNHAANVAMRRLVAEMYTRFHSCFANTEKQELAKDIIYEIKAGGGRFLKEDLNYTGLYIEVNDDLALKKVTLAFRDLKKKMSREAKQRKGLTGGRSEEKSNVLLDSLHISKQFLASTTIKATPATGNYTSANSSSSTNVVLPTPAVSSVVRMLPPNNESGSGIRSGDINNRIESPFCICNYNNDMDLTTTGSIFDVQPSSSLFFCDY
mmetsp:Transcript_13277/g.26657  ORF Transcript_13277/g.26657 Transcript_13277/m.26657 type:complete len:622 (+) Transcript_13277:75-1940(+)